MPDPRVIPDISVLNKLTYLNAFVKEGMEFRPSVKRLWTH